MTDVITSDDLPSDVVNSVDAALLATMIAGANAKATRVAPCLAGVPSADQTAEAKLVLIGAVTRWAEAGSGAFTQQTAGPFSQTTDTRTRSGYNLWPSEITQLQDVCADGKAAGAFSFRIEPTSSSHATTCDLVLGGAACSCGASLTGGFPLYGLDSDGY